MWLEKLYTWMGSLGDLLQDDDYGNYFSDYFQYTPILGVCLAIALGIGVIVALVFYYVCCNKSIKFANIWTWLIALVISMAATFFITKSCVLGSNGEDGNTSTGFYKSIYATYSGLREYQNSEEERDIIDDNKSKLIMELNSGTIDVCNEIAVINLVYAMLTFVILSLLITKVPALRGFTIHGKAIPF